ncbi:probable thiopurine S-methyltransferase isoform X2 [Littorina saxatilis]|uniref:probable thiopurine S-methyltransferase isoform X2 n=1 Tax=Littorina saxatilis TaxID=31220 RepID=UPI0038B68EFE
MFKLYKAFVVSHLEHANVIWFPCPKRRSVAIEQLQRSASKFVKEVHNLDNCECVQALKLSSSKSGRLTGDLFQTCKVTAFFSVSHPCIMSETGTVTSKVMSTDEWVQRWDERAIGFHKDTIHPLLEKHLLVMVNGKTNIRIFFPLCGKALDMKWLADQGHTVIGVEAAQKAVEEFFEEQKVPFTTQSVPAINGKLFQSEDKKLNIYCCDFYNFSKDIAGQVDGIWDRGALVAINNEDREKYATILKGLMAPGCRYLLSALQYDETKYAGDKYSIEMIDDVDALESRHSQWGIDWLREKVFLITPK